jgi:hypothetical protein
VVVVLAVRVPGQLVVEAHGGHLMTITSLSRIAQLDQRTAPPGPMSALDGSGRAAPEEESRRSQCRDPVSEVCPTALP